MRHRQTAGNGTLIAGSVLFSQLGHIGCNEMAYRRNRHMRDNDLDLGWHNLSYDENNLATNAANATYLICLSVLVDAR